MHLKVKMGKARTLDVSTIFKSKIGETDLSV